MVVIDVNGTEITGLIGDAAQGAAIPQLLLLGCMIAESERMDPCAERWGTQTAEAIVAIAARDVAGLQRIIDAVWPDVSFGRGQRIVKFHWAGNGLPTVANCLAVRQAVFDDPARDLKEMALMLASCLKTARQHDLAPVAGDEALGACVVYNAGHWPVDAAEWQARAAHAVRYRESLTKATALIGSVASDPIVPKSAIETRAAELAAKLGNALTGELDLGSGVKLKAFDNAVLLEVPGAGVYTLAEASVAAIFSA
jgi:hypothetical protein